MRGFLEKEQEETFGGDGDVIYCEKGVSYTVMSIFQVYTAKICAFQKKGRNHRKIIRLVELGE